jgi:hypothetical protein
VASFTYFGLWILATCLLIALPLMRMAGAADMYYGLNLPVTAPALQAKVQTVWGPAPLVVEDVRGKLKLPIAALPWSFVALLWGYTALVAALGLVFFHNLRRIFQRVRDGAAFDVQNVVRLRTLGALLLAIAVVNGMAELATSMAVRRGLAPESSLAVPTGFHADLTLVPVALVLIALAEVFRRGAELEHEQSLVV